VADWRDATVIFIALLVASICLGAFCYAGWWIISVVKAG